MRNDDRRSGGSRRVAAPAAGQRLWFSRSRHAAALFSRSKRIPSWEPWGPCCRPHRETLDSPKASSQITRGVVANVSCSRLAKRPSQLFRRAFSQGSFDRVGGRHAPSLMNVAFNQFQLWDGRADALWAQPIKAIEAMPEGDFSRTELAHFIARTELY